MRAEIAALDRALQEQRSSASELYSAIQRGSDGVLAQIEHRIADIYATLGRITDQLVDMMSHAEWSTEYKAQEDRRRVLQERFEAHVRESDQRLGDLRVNGITRAELKILLDSIVSRIDTMFNRLGDLSALLTSLESKAAGQQLGAEMVYRRSDRARLWVIGLAGLILTVTGIIVTEVTNHSHQSPPSITTTTTTLPPTSGQAG